jgi:hypothetical protein
MVNPTTQRETYQRGYAHGIHDALNKINKFLTTPRIHNETALFIFNDLAICREGIADLLRTPKEPTE